MLCLAIIDTGIVNHQDLNGAGIAPFSATYVPNGRFLAGYDFISGDEQRLGFVAANFVANDGDGRDADPSDPGDWVDDRRGRRLYPNSAMTAVRDRKTAAGTEATWRGSCVRNGQQRDGDCGCGLEHSDPSGSSARQVRRVVVRILPRRSAGPLELRFRECQRIRRLRR